MGIPKGLVVVGNQFFLDSDAEDEAPEVPEALMVTILEGIVPEGVLDELTFGLSVKDHHPPVGLVIHSPIGRKSNQKAVNVTPLDWLTYGQNAIREQALKTTISHDKLLLGAAREAVKAHWEIHLLRKDTLDNIRWKGVCGKDGILTNELKARVKMEHTRMGYLCTSSVKIKMDKSFDTTIERDCVHVLGVKKTLLYRYIIDEFNVLVEALDGKLSAIYKWAKLDPGLTLSSHVSKDCPKLPGAVGKSIDSTGFLYDHSCRFDQEMKAPLVNST
ncbi:hypothetical protein GIB67_024353 [Kingdonia uniflora]|uniref:Uncharacterized protein n=1 Tax=Kingdonia uniflora TaxID=39325 RepID=A0A7J7LFE8_9MAGN|nr:hypothetical protein GIB67_024353 [Kingdonia uniflora]